MQNLEYLFIYLIIAFISFIVGFIYLRFIFSRGLLQIKNDFNVICYSFVFGIIIIISLFATFTTLFKTVFLFPFLILLIPFFLKNEKVIRSKDLIPKKKSHWFFVLVVLILIFLFNHNIFHRNDDYFYFDLKFYGKIILGLIDSKVETPYSIYGSYYKYQELMLYHYSDLWFSGFVKIFFPPLNSVKILIYITYPLFHSILVFITVSIFSNSKKSIFIISGVLLLYGVKLFYDLELYSNFPFKWKVDEILIGKWQNRGFPYPIFFNKLLPIYILSLLAYSFYKEKNMNLSLVSFTLLPIFYSTTLPAYLGILVFVFVCFLLFKTKFFSSLNYNLQNKEISKKGLLVLISPILFLILMSLIFDFYSFGVNLKLYSFHYYLNKIFTLTLIQISEHLILILIIFILLIRKINVSKSYPILALLIVAFISINAFYLIFDNKSVDIHQAIFNNSPVILLVFTLELFNYLNNKQMYLVLLLSFIFSLNNLTYIDRNRAEFSVEKNSIEMNSNFKSEVLKEIKSNKDRSVKFIAINNYQDDRKRWDFSLKYFYEDILLDDQVNLPLDLSYLFNDSIIIQNKETHPYNKIYTDSCINERRILSFIKNLNVDYAFTSDINKEQVIVMEKMFFVFSEDRFNNNVFWKKRL